jgi:hypothetical protein
MLELVALGTFTAASLKGGPRLSIGVQRRRSMRWGRCARSAAMRRRQDRHTIVSRLSDLLSLLGTRETR